LLWPLLLLLLCSGYRTVITEQRTRPISKTRAVRGRPLAAGDSASIDAAVVFVVLNPGRDHWCVAAFDMRAKLVGIVDSLGRRMANEESARTILRWLLHWRDWHRDGCHAAGESVHRGVSEGANE
jgi:hypothetical protein